jgi:23S rRNA G2069 N7-methylase RlmK/C1962 C5-methylase RlmI
MNEKTESQAAMLGNRLKKRYRHLSKWARRTGTGAFRLYDRDIPEIPLVLDLYLKGGPPQGNGGACNGLASAHHYVLAGSLYHRPYEKDPAEEDRWLARMEAAIGEALGIPPAGIFMRERRRRRQGESFCFEHPHGSSESAQGPGPGEKAAFAVPEGGLRFWVDLSNHLDTGLFLDRRLLRSAVRDMAKNRRVLNLFAYTCSFSVCAAAAGAHSVDSVDLSNTYLDWGRRNFTLNGFRADPVPEEPPLTGRSRKDGPRWTGGPLRDSGGGRDKGGSPPPFRFIRADVRSFLAKAALARRAWDLIILDPPTFSNSKKMEGTLDIKRDHGPLLKQCLDLLSPGGTLVFSVNMKGFKLDGGIRDGGELIDMTERLRDEDFRERRIPVCYLFKSAPETVHPGL